MSYTDISTARTSSGLTSSTNVADAVVTAKLSYVDGIINAKLGERYLLPLSATCPLITSIAVELVTVLLLMDQYSEEAGDSDKGWDKRREYAMEMLEDIRTGKMLLFDANGLELTRSSKVPRYYPNAASSADDATDSTAPHFTRKKKY